MTTFIGQKKQGDSQQELVLANNQKLSAGFETLPEVRKTKLTKDLEQVNSVNSFTDASSQTIRNQLQFVKERMRL